MSFAYENRLRSPRGVDCVRPIKFGPPLQLLSCLFVCSRFFAAVFRRTCCLSNDDSAYISVYFDHLNPRLFQYDRVATNGFFQRLYVNGQRSVDGVLWINTFFRRFSWFHFVSRFLANDVCRCSSFERLISRFVISKVFDFDHDEGVRKRCVADDVRFLDEEGDFRAIFFSGFFQTRDIGDVGVRTGAFDSADRVTACVTMYVSAWLLTRRFDAQDPIVRVTSDRRRRTGDRFNCYVKILSQDVRGARVIYHDDHRVRIVVAYSYACCSFRFFYHVRCFNVGGVATSGSYIGILCDFR